MKKINWRQLLNIVLSISTIGSFAFGIYAFYYIKSPSLTIIKLSEINVLEINRVLDDLKILYKDEDIQKGNKDIKIIVLTIKNSGKVDITQNMYDEKIPWGIIVNNGDIVQVRLIDSSDSYLSNTINPKIQNNEVLFNKQIIESGEYFSIELVILCDKSASIKYQMTGKISGLNNSSIKFIENYNVQRKSFWSNLLFGTFGLHLARLFFYFLCIIVFSLLIGFIIQIITSIKNSFIRHERKVRIRLLISDNDIGQHVEDIKKIYIKEGYQYLKHIAKILGDKQKLEFMYRKKHILMKRKTKNSSIHAHENYIRNYRYFSVMKDMIEYKMIIIDNNTISIDDKYHEEIKRFINCIKK